MGGLTDATIIGVVVWAIIAVVAGMGLAVAAITLVRRARDCDYDFEAGYNALAPVTER
jgi:hypothetical protein